MQVRRSIVVVMAASMLVVAGCSAAEPEPIEGTEEPLTAEDVVAETTVVAATEELRAEVYPVMRTDDRAVLTVDLTPSGDEEVSLFTFFGATSSPPIHSPGAIRLLDLEGKNIYLPGKDADGGYIGSGDYVTVEPAGTRLQLAYAAPPEERETLSLLLPGSGLIESIPVIDGEAPTPSLEEDAETEPTVADAVDLPVLPLGSYTRELDGAVDTITDQEVVEVTLSADVLFASESAELGAEADEIIDLAAQKLLDREPGTVNVVGHTDDLGSEAYNQDLSEQRAAAVAEALAGRIDTDTYPIETEGRAYHEPVVPNTDDASRAQNRRVTLTLVSVAEAPAELDVSGDLPPFEDGPIATGDAGVEIEHSGYPWQVRAPEARLAHGNLIVDLQITMLGDEENGSGGPGFLSSVWSYRGHSTSQPQNSSGGVAVLSGTTAVYPLDYLAGVARSGTELWQTVSDLDVTGGFAPGQTRTYSIVYPGIGDVETITLQQGQALGTKAFRLTDIPVIAAPE